MTSPHGSDDSVPIRDYMALQIRRLDDLRIAELRRLDDLRAADKETMRDTRVAMEERLKGLNELRGDVAPKAALEALQRLVYIGTGLAIAASVVIPIAVSLLIRK